MGTSPSALGRSLLSTESMIGSTSIGPPSTCQIPEEVSGSTCVFCLAFLRGGGMGGEWGDAVVEARRAQESVCGSGWLRVAHGASVHAVADAHVSR